MINLSHSAFIDVMASHNYEVNYAHDPKTFPDSKPYNLNIVGYRNRFGKSNSFDDTIAIYYQDGVEWNELFFEATTMPGTPYLMKPLSPKGTAILVPGQYQYKIGFHKGSYEALIQARPVKVYRDKNKDYIYDMDSRTVEEGFFGIDIHRASIGAKLVGVNSAGCQVIKSSIDFEQFMRLCRKRAYYWGSDFTYTLVEI